METGLLALLHLAHVGLVHVHLQLHAAQVFGEGEQHRGGHRGGHRLAGLDLAGEHHAVDGRVDGGLGEADLVSGQQGPGRGHAGLRGLLVGDGPQRRGLAGVELGLGGHLAAGEPRHLLQPGQAGGGLGHRGPGLADPRLGGGDLGLGLAHLVTQLGGIEAGEHLALLHPVVHIHKNGFDDARQLAAHIHRVGGLQVAVGRHVDDQLALTHGLGEVARAVVAVAADQGPGEQPGETEAGHREGDAGLAPEATAAVLEDQLAEGFR